MSAVHLLLKVHRWPFVHIVAERWRRRHHGLRVIAWLCGVVAGAECECLTTFSLIAVVCELLASLLRSDDKCCWPLQNLAAFESHLGQHIVSEVVQVLGFDFASHVGFGNLRHDADAHLICVGGCLS